MDQTDLDAIGKGGSRRARSVWLPNSRRGLTVTDAVHGAGGALGQRRYVAAAEGDRGFWSDACEDRGYHMGGDSAHSIMKRLAPAFHASVPHYCKLDRRVYLWAEACAVAWAMGDGALQSLAKN